MHTLTRRSALLLFLLVGASACGGNAGAGSSVNVTADDSGRTIP
ncbi:MAG TPA: hypothetical protein VE669_06430 [Actinomycetota bacterium]|jgi:ABC-type glycerol-3-phosphate transport system substrate-binding protein|nr:hypothetical protein [Actinomycetota bacterium]